MSGGGEGPLQRYLRMSLRIPSVIPFVLLATDLSPATRRMTATARQAMMIQGICGDRTFF